MTMHIEHIAFWTNQLEELKGFYETYFQAKAGVKYYNPTKQFESYFLSFSSGVRLELMHQAEVQDKYLDPHPKIGYAHLSFGTGSEKSVDELTDRLKKDGIVVLNGPRHTGDGYYESVVLDPDGNQIEVTI
jgi:lactoylglutathione lyase